MFAMAIYLISCWILAYFDGLGKLPSIMFIYNYIFATINIIYFSLGKKTLRGALALLLMILLINFSTEYFMLIVTKEVIFGEFHSEAFAVYFFMTFLPSIFVYFISFGVARALVSVSGMRSKE